MTATKTDAKPAPVATLTNCKCLTGTGQQCTASTRKAFAQGHDARMSSRIATAIAKGDLTEAKGTELIRQAGGGDLLISKTVHSAHLRAAKGTEPKPAKAKKGTEAPAAKVPSVVGQACEVFHGKRKFKGAVVRNAQEQLVARHRLNSQNCDHDVEVGEDGEIFTK